MKSILKYLAIGLAALIGVNLGSFVQGTVTAPAGSKPEFSLPAMVMSLLSLPGIILVVIVGLVFSLLSNVFGKKNLTP